MGDQTIKLNNKEIVLNKYIYRCEIIFKREVAFYKKRNNNKVDSIETRRIVIANLLP